jgi:hypothetical protein
MSMADDNTLRSNRSNDPFRRGTAAAGMDTQPHSRDPLAELARLIGQTDPFAESPSNTRHPADVAAAPAADWRGRATPVAAAPRTQPPAADPRGAPPNPFYQRRDPYQVASGERTAPPDLRELHDAPPFAAPHTAPPPRADAYRAGVGDRGEENAFLAQGEPLGPDDNDIYDDAPPARWRGGITAITIIVCATLGSAAAYGYRSYSTTVRETQAPPVITAEKAPTKVIPATDQSGKSITDRIRDQVPNERMVSREEQPVELRNMITPAQPRVVLQGSPSTQQAPIGIPGMPGAVVPPPQSAASPNNGTTPISEPKRVRTVTIRPDGPDLSGRPVGSIGTLPQQPRPATPPSTRGGGPISLDPQASEPPAATAPPTRVATATPAAGSNVATGSYTVQISSQKTDAEAQASIRALQAKYPHLLNSKPPHVSRADLGAKGVFYRAVVGPFASASEANSLCNGLKAAGGQCVIQKN